MESQMAPVTDKIEPAMQAFEAQFPDSTPARLYRAPGRVNLIGEHTDYNDGFVMPAAIAFYTTVAAAPRSDRKLVIFSTGFNEKVEFDIDNIAPAPAKHWSDYVRGVAGVLISQGHSITGANLAISSDVPIGAGLSSSAALEVSVALALLDLSGITMDRMAIARACQRAEHVYSGTLCGIMDQFISCHGEAAHALMLDCRSLNFESLPLAEDVELVICNTKVHHNLASGEYNRRRASCEEGVRLLQPFLPGIKALRDVTPEQLEEHKASLPELTYRRCRHVVTEDARVEASAVALKSGELAKFGEFMAQSHVSLRDDYEVSCKELDTMVRLAAAIPGVIGSRMTGGGFGGCTINLVKADAAAEFAKRIAADYERETGIKPEVYICKAAAGASALPEAN
jgi:galactokinase